MAEITNPRIAARVTRIKSTVSILRVLGDFGYQVRDDGGDREQQFACDLHGDGRDNSPSARVFPYGDEPHWYCFACGVSRDAIETVRAKQGLGFMEAIRFLEQRYGLPTLPFDGSYQRPETAYEGVLKGLRHDKTFEDDVGQVRTLLDNMTKDQELPMLVTLAFWEAFDKVVWMVTDEKALPKMSERLGREALEKIRVRLIERWEEEMAG